ncbi:hypothetical protein OS121_29740 [Mycolicibacterium mucogenicum]|uniref:hypothetical protein n=1 Tax=Mycolicibacterium mucogenicum TaxID=56689 RepID=UPI00226A08BA|nr:hypothetical protein [Mycolicibacterium mucogenicum]MCX8559232.1 hypothetical protein [Mycolicibacterium mucogenicum]
MGLTGAARHVLAAVVELLPRRWKRVRDDRVQLAQLVELCEVPHHQRTVGRELARLAAAEIIVYTPAQGRGRTATIAIHERLLGGVEELERDDDGAVVVPFSRRPPYINQELPPYPPKTPSKRSEAARTRPTEVKVQPNDVKRVLTEMPAVFRELPRPLRWLLGRAIRDKLARGWRPTDVLALLSAPLPATVARPYLLARWRLTQNMVGSGPLLAPLEREHDREVAAARRRQDDDRQRSAYRRVHGATSLAQQDAMLAALAHRLDLDPAGIDRERALVSAARIAQREHPDATLRAAIAAWLRDDRRRDASPPEASSVVTEHGTAALAGLLVPASPAGTCVSCDSAQGSIRPELPLPTPICDSCWSAHADPELLEIPAS